MPLSSLLLAASLALAYTPSGLSLPATGGALSSPGQGGVRGLVMNPAAALPSGPEFLLDAGALRYRYGFKLEGQEPVSSDSQDLIPYLAAAVPVGRFGLGLTGMLPYARSGSSPPDGIQRFHTILGRVLLFEADLSLAWKASDRLALGAGLLAGRALYRSSVAIDSGVLLNGILGTDAAPVGDPFLEGTRTVDLAIGHALGFSLGTRVEPWDRVVVSAGYRSALRTTVRGDLELLPSNDLAMVLEGNLAGDFSFPPEAFLAVVVPVGPLDVEVDGGWIGWSATAVSRLRVDDLVLVSEDPVMEALLASYGLTDPTLLGSLETLGMYGLHDILHGGISGRMPLPRGLDLLAGAWYAPAAMDERWVAPGNFDFASVDARLAPSWTPTRRVTVALAGDLIWYQPRTVTDSVYAWDNDPDVAPALPPANGHYWFHMFRVGATAHFRI